MKTIKLNHITKIEGHAKLHVIVSKGKVKKCALKIYEGARFFEGILKEKMWNDLPHISSRICGVCSPVHAITSVKAIENAFNIKISKQAKILREIIKIGGDIQSHVLHLYFLALPDYTGYSNALQMLPKFKKEIERALKIKRVGNAVVDLLGGRDIHPIAVIPGGMSRVPETKTINCLLKGLKSIKKDAKATVELFDSLDYPHFDHPKPLVALTNGSYFDASEIIVCQGSKCIKSKDYEKHFEEFFQKGSTAEFVTKDGKSYMVGALARLYHNSWMLSKYSQRIAKRILKHKYSPYMNNVAQAIEIYESVRQCIKLLENTEFKKQRPKKVFAKKSVGVGATEAPRGILFHKYKFDKKGVCTYANITTPTSQNLLNLQRAIKLYLPSVLDRSESEIKLEIEKLIRAYDPCISCSTHFLELKLEGR